MDTLVLFMNDCLKKVHLNLACKLQGVFSPFWEHEPTLQLRCHKMVIFFFSPRIGNFLLEIGKKYTFCHWEHDPISVAKMGQKNPGVTFLAFVVICLSFFQEHYQCHSAWIQIRFNDLSGLIRVQTVGRGYE